jgi:hypothetical protein
MAPSGSTLFVGKSLMRLGVRSDGSRHRLSRHFLRRSVPSSAVMRASATATVVHTEQHAAVDRFVSTSEEAE